MKPWIERRVGGNCPDGRLATRDGASARVGGSRGGADDGRYRRRTRSGVHRERRARGSTRAPPPDPCLASAPREKEPPKPHSDCSRSRRWVAPRKRRGFADAGTHVIDVRNHGHVADVVLLVHLATELIDGELRREGRRGTGPSAVRARALKRWGWKKAWCQSWAGSSTWRGTRRPRVGFARRARRIPSRDAPSAWLR